MQIVCIYLKAFIDYYNIYKSAYPDSEIGISITHMDY